MSPPPIRRRLSLEVFGPRFSTGFRYVHSSGGFASKHFRHDGGLLSHLVLRRTQESQDLFAMTKDKLTGSIRFE